ncbi:serine hydrolase domain-containing protein [Sphingomonas astaxanthinifaciens]|uniref:Serine hydrolase n=1 Tax=Sphingomonas astaxanthinifaciens DSM 22298 TaxID=1123267 RepID=A0ABQ5Z885_9SPHN|nr:serine hydrolase domain-containing protein [Sphingomonas astaxanthinifaciens]GLR47004.1 serine hydrolase [Sphingomonas astaxanthinifaciens DSM 22298]
MSIDRRFFLGGVLSSALAAGPSRAAPVHPADLVIDRFARENGFAGSVSLARHGRITHQRLFGLADRAAHRPVTPATTFRIGSISKWFTALAVLRLVDRGRMALSAPIGTYLPTLDAAYAAVPLEHLLANDSGIPDRVTQAIKDDPALRDSRDGSAAMVTRFGDGPLAFSPGARFDYSFFNWVLIHAALERVTGKPFEQVLGGEVFRPLGLSRTGFVDTRSGDVPGLAGAYAPGGQPKEVRVPPFGGASGNIHAGAGDLARAAHLAFETGRLLRPATRAELLRVRVPSENYALGGRVRTIAGRRVAWETGKVQAYRTHLAHVVGEDRTIVLLNNTDISQDAIGALVEQLLPLA